MPPSTLRFLPRSVLALLLTTAVGAEAQSILLPARGAVTGTVRDSLAGGMLVGARVQLVGADSAPAAVQTTITGADGRFRFEAVAPGQYLLGFLHPLLDSLGIEPPVRAVLVRADRTTQADLAFPGARRLHAAMCGGSTGGAVLVGFVRPARAGEGMPGATVVAEWTELSVGNRGIGHRTARRTVQTRDNGWFALCDVPAPGTLLLMASRGRDSTDRLETQVPPQQLARVDLYLGAARTVSSHERGPARESATAARRILSGEGRLAGRVLHADGLAPLRGAVVRVIDGPDTRANEQGEFLLTGVPEGSRTLEVRAVGFYPVRRTVHVVDGAPAMTVALTTLRSVLDTMQIRASRTRVDGLRGFTQRMRSGQGRYLTSADIARRMPQFTMDIFRNQAGIRVLGDTILVRGMGGLGTMRSLDDTLRAARTLGSSDGFYCWPTIYVDGRPMQRLLGGDINVLMNPREIRGVEIYSATQTPAEFSDGLTGCGVIVFWTR